MKTINQPMMIGLGALVAAAVVGWVITKIMDKATQPGAAGAAGVAVGSAVVDATMGVVAGVNDTLGIPRTSDVINAANDPSINPLQPFGAWLGGTIYDVIH